jgi:Fic family protein
MSETYEHPGSLVLMPPEDHAGMRQLQDLSTTLALESAALGGRLAPRVAAAIGDLVRSMNCYYSNLIEGHATTPIDIQRAMAEEYSDNPDKRDLQLEARSHILVQSKIDRGEYDKDGLGCALIRHMHRDFYKNLPDSLRVVYSHCQAITAEVRPGEWRTNDVRVGHHISVAYAAVPAFMKHFEEGYDPKRIWVSLVWIHPFTDGNGRVSRLFAHAYLRHFNMGSALWSVSRGLARRRDDYKALLARADAAPQTTTDGRGTLSDGRLVEFCAFFLETCIDQVRYMKAIIDPENLITRTREFVGAEAANGKLDLRLIPLLEQLVARGEVPKSDVPRLLNVSVAHAKRLIAPLRERSLLISAGHTAPWELAFPLSEVERIFPRLFTAAAAGEAGA